MMPSVVFSGFVIVLIGLGFSALVNPRPSDFVYDLHRAIENRDPFAEQLAREINDECINGRYDFTIKNYDRGYRNGLDKYIRLITTTLNWALFYDQETVALILIAKGADIFETDQFGNTPLHIAADRGLEKSVSKLMDIISDIEIMDKVKMSKQQVIDLQNLRGKTALHLALHNRRKVVIKKLLAEGANSVVADHQGNTALHLSATEYSSCTGETFIDLIKAARPKPNELLRQSGMSPRFYTCLIKQLSDVGLNGDLSSEIFSRACEGINLMNHYGRTALSFAVRYQLLDIAQILFENGADPTIGIRNMRLLDSSLSDGMILSVIQNTAVNHQYNDGCSLLHFAVKCRRDVVVKNLLHRGADPTIADNDGNTALHLALNNFLSDETIIRMIKAARPNSVDIVGHNGMTNPCCLKRKLDHRDRDRDVISPASYNILNFQNHKGETIFFLAVYFARAKIAQILLKIGADPSITDNDGNTALHLAMNDEGSGWSTIEMFKAALPNTVNTDGDVKYVNNYGDSLRHIAGDEMVKELLRVGADTFALHHASKYRRFKSIIRHMIIRRMITPGRLHRVIKNEGQTGIGKFRRTLSCTFRHMRQFFTVSCSKIINLQNHKKETSLYLAVSDQRLAVVEILLGLGADRTIKVNGQTALGLAIQMEAENRYKSAAEIVKLLSIVNTTT